MMIGIALALAFVGVVAAPSEEFAKNITFDGQVFAVSEQGTMKARAIVGTVSIFDFAKYAPDSHEGADRHLLVLRAARSLSAKQVQSVFRGVLKDRSGFTDAEKEKFIALLPAADRGSIIRFRSQLNGTLDVFAGDKLVGSVVSTALSGALWAGFSN